MEYYSSTKKNDVMPFAATWMDLEGIMISDESEEDKYQMTSHVESYKYNKLMNKTKKQTHR